MTKRRSLDIVANSMYLIAAKVAIMAMGFVFWLVAARAFDAETVGLAAAAVSAVMLCTQLALLGMGSSFITLLPVHRERPGHLFDTAVATVAIVSLLASVVFLGFADSVLDQLSTLTAQPLFDVSFVIVAIVGTLGILFDQASTALRRGDQAMTRAAVSGGVTLVNLIGFAYVLPRASANAIFFTWLTGGVAAAVFALWQFSRSIPNYRYRPRLDATLARGLLRVGVPNHLLTLSERVPGFVLPIAVTELLSPTQNAYWYAAWMMAWVVFIIPIQVGMTLFAEVTDQPERLDSHLRRGLATSLIIGGVAAVGAIILAPLALGLLGGGYAAAGTTALRILVIGVFPLSVLYAYFAICRARRQLGEALVLGCIAAIGGTVVSAAAGMHAGLTGMAVAWLLVQAVVGMVAGFRLRSLLAKATRVQPVAMDAAVRLPSEPVP